MMLLVVILAVLSVAATSPTSHGFDPAFNDFLNQHDYIGGAAAAMKDGRLVFAKGYGVDRDGNDVKAHSKFHVSSLAKSFTAVAILRLIQEGRVSLTDKVFGEEGILADITPWRNDTVDQRLYMITVDHLLRHSCGWDVDQGPLYDPVLNRLYLDRGHDVTDIAREMGTTWPLTPRALISYVMSQPLDYTPGTRTAYSNIGYLVLGRIVEAASQMKYRDFVIKYILEPCGMWNTRLELAAGHKNKQTRQTMFGGKADDSQGEQTLYRAVDPVYADSALGWFSTVYDLMRFTRCTFETGQILDDRHLEVLLERPRPSRDPTEEGKGQQDDGQVWGRVETWHAAGFRTNVRGVVWQDGDLHADDLILYHDLRLQADLEENFIRSKRDVLKQQTHDGGMVDDKNILSEKELKEQLTREVAEERDRLPESWVILLHGRSINHIRHHSRDLMSLLDTSASALPKENLFLHDLSDLHRHPAWKPQWEDDVSSNEADDTGEYVELRPRTSPDMTLRYHVDEHHLTAYIDALQDEGFDVHWFTSCTIEGHTSFLVLGRRVERPVRSQYDFVFKHDLDHRQLLKNKLWLEERGYNLTQLHSYTRRMRTGDKQNTPKKSKTGRAAKRNAGLRGTRVQLTTRYAAIFRYGAYTPGTQMKYGTGHFPEPYHKLVQMYQEKGFYPTAQTITRTRNGRRGGGTAGGGENNEEFAFVFVKGAGSRYLHTEFRQVYGLGVKDLVAETAKAIKEQLRLAYLTSYEVEGGDYNFSAVYTNGTQARGMLETGKHQADVSETTAFNMVLGVAPKFVVPYVERRGLVYAVYYEEF